MLTKLEGSPDRYRNTFVTMSAGLGNDAILHVLQRTRSRLPIRVLPPTVKERVYLRKVFE